jgi:hypothetical protein
MRDPAADLHHLADMRRRVGNANPRRHAGLR